MLAGCAAEELVDVTPGNADVVCGTVMDEAGEAFEE